MRMFHQHAVPSFQVIHPIQRPGLPAGLTLEAAVALPIMMLAIWLLLTPLRVMDAERKLAWQAEETARTLSVAAYVRQTGMQHLKSGDEMGTLPGQYTNLAGKGLFLAALSSCRDAKVLGKPLPGAGTAILSEAAGADPSMIHVELEYPLALPVRPFSLPLMPRKLVVHRRAWVGSPGGRGRGRYDPEHDPSDTDPIVYVGKNSTRYHLDLHCHYLSNVLLWADAAEMTALRNSGGARYHPCPSCRPGTSGSVCYFASGTAFHASENCRAITAYARAVHLSEVADLGPCSYCGRK